MPIRHGCLWTHSVPLDQWLEEIIQQALTEKLEAVVDEACDMLNLPGAIEDELSQNYCVENGQLVVDVLCPYGTYPGVDEMLVPVDAEGKVLEDVPDPAVIEVEHA
jgi:hypothetical protein